MKFVLHSQDRTREIAESHGPSDRIGHHQTVFEPLGVHRQASRSLLGRVFMPRCGATNHENTAI